MGLYTSYLKRWMARAMGPSCAKGAQAREKGGGEARQRGQVAPGKVPGSAQVRQQAGGKRSTAVSHVSQKKAPGPGSTRAQAMHAGG